MASITARASASARSGVPMTVGVTTHRTPSASMAAAWEASTTSTTSVPTHGAYSRATPTTEGSVPSSAMSRSAGPLSAAPAPMGDTPTTRSRRATRASRTPGTARTGPIETTGFEGHTTMVSASPSASMTPGAGRAVLARLSQRDPGAQWVVGHGYQPHRDAAPPRQFGRYRAERLTGPQQARAEQMRGQVAIAQAEPVFAAQPRQLVHDGPALAGHAP